MSGVVVLSPSGKRSYDAFMKSMNKFHKHKCGDTQLGYHKTNIGYCKYNKAGKWRAKILPMQFFMTAKRETTRMGRKRTNLYQYTFVSVGLREYNKAPCMCCHLPTLRCTTLYVVTSALRREAAPHLHVRARLRPIEKRRTPLCREKVKKYTLPLNALAKRNPRRSICRRLWCILSPGCSADQSMILRRYGVQLETPLPSPCPFQHYPHHSLLRRTAQACTVPPQ